MAAPELVLALVLEARPQQVLVLKPVLALEPELRLALRRVLASVPEVVRELELALALAAMEQMSQPEPAWVQEEVLELEQLLASAQVLEEEEVELKRPQAFLRVLDSVRAWEQVQALLLVQVLVWALVEDWQSGLEPVRALKPVLEWVLEPVCVLAREPVLVGGLLWVLALELAWEQVPLGVLARALVQLLEQAQEPELARV